jgi:hypothetical protein
MAEIVSFMIAYGPAVIVIAIMITGFFVKKPTNRPYLKWVLVAFLTLVQLWLWQAIDNFDGAFGNSRAFEAETFTLSAVVVGWFVYQIISFAKAKTGPQ